MNSTPSLKGRVVLKERRHISPEVANPMKVTLTRKGEPLTMFLANHELSLCPNKRPMVGSSDQTRHHNGTDHHAEDL